MIVHAPHRFRLYFYYPICLWAHVCYIGPSTHAQHKFVFVNILAMAMVLLVLAYLTTYTSYSLWSAMHELSLLLDYQVLG